jgi:hypothetical protein
MTREPDWMLFDKACDITASAVRGAMGGQDSKPAAYAGDVFREIHRALREAADTMPDKPKAGFSAEH